MAFITGPDNPPFWGDRNISWYYDLRGLKKKRLVFYARSDTNARIQVLVGLLSGKKFGDSLCEPVQTEWLELTPEWKQYQLDLSDPELDISRICNGFTFRIDRDHQTHPALPVQFMLDDIYFE